MLPEDHVRPPQVDSLLQGVAGLLDGYDPTTLVYLSPSGRWLANPSKPRDRISNEVWFRLWQATGRPGGWDAIRNLVTPLLETQSTRDIAQLIHTGPAPDGAVPTDDLMAVMELVYWLVEYEACRRISHAYVARWDTKGKARQEGSSERGKVLAARLPESGVEGGAESRLSALCNRLTNVESSLFDSVCRIITEEESMRYDLQGPKGEDELCGGGQLDLRPPEGERFASIAGLSPPREGLLRPCMELLIDPALNVQSGIQYRVADVLAVLRDPRSADTLLAALERWPARYTDLRSKIVYALGNLSLRKTLPCLVSILESPDSVEITDGARAYAKPRHAEKREAVWALGKLGPAGLDAVGALASCADSSDRDIRTHLAWAMGEIGRGQKHESGGIDARILITLLSLLTSRDGRIVEEAAAALKTLDMPDFLHSLYLQDFGTVPMLSLKPSSTGLYELSETILHLASLKRPVVMAVTGDSGTGKTYFCRAIAAGFGGIQAHEILYLMRDRTHDKTFDKMLGIKWLRQHVEPVYYEDYPVAEDRDDPDGFFEAFIRSNSNKRLIILDGWRDAAYFHPVIRKFYDRGYLDLLVRFQTRFSTRRLNLEEREDSLDRVEVHLPLTENPAMEETRFYREGEVLIYDLDNSLGSRLNGDEILEVFDRRKVDTWGDQIRIGHFGAGSRDFEVTEHTLTVRSKPPPVGVEPIGPMRPAELRPVETTFTRSLNPSLDDSPNLLETVTTEEMRINRIAFYTHGQLAACGDQGSVGILTGFNDRLFSARVHDAAVSAVAVAAGRIYSGDTEGVLKVTSFGQKQTTVIGETGSCVNSIAAHRRGTIVTGHEDGTVRKWDVQGGEVAVLRGLKGSVRATAIDRQGCVYAGGVGGDLWVWDTDRGEVRILEGLTAPVTAVALYLDGRIVTGTGLCDGAEADSMGHSGIALIGPDGARSERFILPDCSPVSAVTVYFDGRIFVGTGVSGQPAQGTLAVIDPRGDERSYVALPGHQAATLSCVTMGPTLITCGREGDTGTTLKIWGTSSYVRTEHAKLRLMPEHLPRPPYYRALF